MTSYFQDGGHDVILRKKPARGRVISGQIRLKRGLVVYQENIID